jgi:hypothetical protein
MLQMNGALAVVDSMCLKLMKWKPTKVVAASI